LQKKKLLFLATFISTTSSKTNHNFKLVTVLL